MFVIPFHNIDPVIFRISPALSLNWYGMSYLAGIVFVMWQGERMAVRRPLEFPKGIFQNAMFLGMISIVIGGRLGDVIFYNLDFYLYNPLEIFATWKGGMSFHGGLIGAVLAVVFHTRRHKISAISFTDILAANVPIALMFGRIANFINGELYGRPTDVSWAIPFPKGGGIPRHPSQLYEAALEGLILYVVLRMVYKYAHHIKGITTAAFLMGYGSARFLVEYFRDAENLSWIQSNYLSGGQILSLPMILIGIFLLFFFYKKGKISNV